MSGFIDLDESRRTSYEMAKWWPQSRAIDGNGKIRLDILNYKTKAEGVFSCEEVSPPQTYAGGAGDIRFTAKTCSIATTDDVYGKIHRDDLILYGGVFWRVESIQLQREWRKSAFQRRNFDGRKIISLRA